MSTVAEMKAAFQHLPQKEAWELVDWIHEVMARRASAGGEPAASACRDHSAFLNSYAPEDDRLYEDAQSR